MEILYLLITGKVLFWTLQKWKIPSHFKAKSCKDGIVWLLKSFFFFTFWRWEVRLFSESKSWWKDDAYWLRKDSCFELFGDGKHGLCYPKSFWKDDIHWVFLSFQWYSRIWEKWFFLQCIRYFLRKCLYQLAKK